MTKREQVLLSIMEKANEDNDFRAAMLSDPIAAIKSEFGLQVPEGVKLVVHENDSSTVHLPLPPRPETLSEGELEQVSGGSCGGCGCY